LTLIRYPESSRMGGFKEWVDGWMGGWVDGWMGGWVDGWV